ncbi:MAG: YbbR-like domain-containing protein [Flavobacteriaceae bacterium]
MRKIGFKQFVYFFIIAALIWFFNQLSKPVTLSSTVKIRFSEVPDTLLLESNDAYDIPIRISGTGFRVLFDFSSNKELQVPLTPLQYVDGTYLMSAEAIEDAIFSQTPETISIDYLSATDIAVQASLLKTKRIKVIPRMFTSYVPNYVAIDSARIDPSFVEVRGTEESLISVDEIFTESVRLENIKASINIKVPLDLRGLEDLRISDFEILFSQEVARFSERIFEVPVLLPTLEDGNRIQLFTNTISVLCKAPTTLLNNWSEQDFEVSVLIDSTFRVDDKQLPLKLTKEPVGVLYTELLTSTVDFLIER